ncbi:MAG: PAS domain S-box protein [Nitrospinaceae bacterium]|nr:PAS domain S-box protein [Nitrospinaceae bacterium]
MTLFFVLVFSLSWELWFKERALPVLQMLFASSSGENPWLEAGVHVALVALAMVFTLPALLGDMGDATVKTVTELGKTERRYKSIIESTNDLIFQLDTNGIILFANPAVRLLGYEDGELVGQFIGDILYMDDKEEVLPEIMTKRVGHRATYHLPLQLMTSPHSVISSEIPAMEFVADSCGLWEEADHVVQARGTEKKFIGTLCIARPVIKPEDLQRDPEPETEEEVLAE